MRTGGLLPSSAYTLSPKKKEKRVTSYLSHSHRLHRTARHSIAYARALLVPVSARTLSTAISCVRASSTGRAALPTHIKGDRCHLHHEGGTPGRWPGRPPPLLAQLAATECGARPHAAHDSPSGARPRTSCARLPNSPRMGQNTPACSPRRPR
jgi:hypothetical protein